MAAGDGGPWARQQELQKRKVKARPANRATHMAILFSLSGKRICKVLCTKKRARPKHAGRAPCWDGKLENELAAKLKSTRTPVTVRPSEVVASEGRVEAIEFGMVEGVE